MKINALPKYNMEDNPTNCCPRFKPGDWDGLELEFKDKLFVRATTKSLFHIPVNVGKVFPKTFASITNAGAFSDDNFIILSHDPSAWKGEHLFAVTKDIPEQDMIKLSGNFLTKVFEGPFKNAPIWCKEMESYIKGKNRELKKTYFFYTTCPKCAKVYRKNYVVAVAEVE